VLEERESGTLKKKKQNRGNKQKTLDQVVWRKATKEFIEIENKM
jgi:hypothetical protein